MESFYNTIRMSGADLFSANKQARTQEDIILQIFKESDGELTPFEVNDRLELNSLYYPITSIRRSITNLTKRGKLIKTEIKRQGEYGQINYTWRIKNG